MANNYIRASNQGSGLTTGGSSTDNAAVRWDGATATAIQNSGVVIDDSNNITGVNNLTIGGGTITLSVDTNVVLNGGVNGISFDTTTLSIDATNDRVGIGTAAPSSTLHVSGGISFKRTATAASYTALVTDYYIGVTSTAAARTIDLPAAATAGAGKIFIIKDESGAAGTNNITVDGSGAETIDGAATAVINANFGSVSIICSGTAWFIF